MQGVEGPWERRGGHTRAASGLMSGPRSWAVHAGARAPCPAWVGLGAGGSVAESRHREKGRARPPRADSPRGCQEGENLAVHTRGGMWQSCSQLGREEVVKGPRQGHAGAYLRTTCTALTPGCSSL